MENLSELQHQAKIFRWAKENEDKYPDLKWLHSSLNGICLAPKLAIQAKASGMKAGIADIFLPVKNDTYNGLFIELKKPGNGPTNEQKEFLKFVNSQGFLGLVSIGNENTIKIIQKYLTNNLAEC